MNFTDSKCFSFSLIVNTVYTNIFTKPAYFSEKQNKS